MEASIMNIVERGEPILVCINGMWGKRAREIAERRGLGLEILKLVNIIYQRTTMDLFDDVTQKFISMKKPSFMYDRGGGGGGGN